MLETYTRKRDFKRTSEPSGKDALKPADGPLRFVVQKHTARALHYDFRLEAGGVLKSWPIPKGPSLDPSVKRLAVMTEDHPLDYATFEGVIPKGEYGGGEVIVWDAGVYAPLIDEEPVFDREKAEPAVLKGIEKGRLKVRLHGRKLRGVWSLVHTKDKQWLFLKRDDADADAARDLTADDDSVLSGLTNDDLERGRRPDDSITTEFIPDPSRVRGARRASVPARIEAMLPTLTDRAFSHPDWIFEPKLDGYRVLAIIQDGSVQLRSRRGIDATAQYPWLIDALRRQPWDMVIDGELVAYGADGKPSFQAMQNRGTEPNVDIRFYAFDLLFVDGWDVRKASLVERKSLLHAMFVPSERARLVECIENDGEALFQASTQLGLEGIVAKRKDSAYDSGRRSPHWLKMKNVQTDDFLIGGFTAGLGGRADTLGSLLLGRPTDEKGKLRYVGHVGSGFNDASLRDVLAQLEPLRRQTSPFVNDVPSKGRWSRKDRGAPKWVEPKLVAEVKYAEITRDDILRAPVFLRLRDDLDPSDAESKPVIAAPESKAPPKPTVDPFKASRDVLEQLREKKQAFTVFVGEFEVKLTNLEKPLWPARGRSKPVTKRDLAQYFMGVSPWLLPHLRDRPITLVRYPNGLDGQHFYQRHSEHALPPFVDAVMAYSDHGGGDREYLMCNNLATLLWLAQMGTLEIHPWYSRAELQPDALDLPLLAHGSDEIVDASVLNYPDFLVFDLDPYQYSGKEAAGAEPELHKVGFAGARQVALWLKELLDSMQLPSYVKTTGKTGLHIFVPIVRNMPYEQTHALCQALSQHLATAHPEEVTVEWAVNKRRGKVFADYNQNVRSKTLASLLSPRAMAEAAVSMPVTWDELDSGKIYPTQFTVRTALERLERVGDPWADIIESKVDLHARLNSGQASARPSGSTRRKK
jgi:bifunctional non-homologous end joining protein LigD